MNIEQEIRDQIERNKELKQEVGHINNHLNILERFCREDKQKQVDDAHKRGFEDGKASIERGCGGCRYESKKSHEEPCFSCARNYMDQYEPMPKQDDSIKVGDEVIHSDGSTVVVTMVYADGGFEWCEGVRKDGRAYHMLRENVHKTGKHYDIQSILEAMQDMTER